MTSAPMIGTQRAHAPGQAFMTGGDERYVFLDVDYGAASGRYGIETVDDANHVTRLGTVSSRTVTAPGPVRSKGRQSADGADGRRRRQGLLLGQFGAVDRPVRPLVSGRIRAPGRVQLTRNECPGRAGGRAARRRTRGPGRARARVGWPGSSTKSLVSTECAMRLMPHGLPGDESISTEMKPSPSSRRSVSNRVAGTSWSPVKRSPSTHAPSATRSLTRARSASMMPRSALCFFERVSGSDGWLSTGASIRSSTIIAEREPAGEAHAHRADARARRTPRASAAPSARSHTVIGLVFVGRQRGELLRDAGRARCSASCSRR